MFATVPVGAAVLAWFTLMAVAPIRRPGRMAVVSWLSAAAVNELPFLYAALVALALLPELVTGGPSSLGGGIGMALNGLTLGGLAVVARRAWPTRRHLREVLDAGVGDRWRDEVDPAVVARLERRRPRLRSVVAPVPIRPRSVERLSDIAYGGAGAANRLDVYRHRSRPPGAPTLIHLHGGHFRWGAKSREARPLLHHLADRGWTCISANYRLSGTPAEGFPGHLIDVKRVIAWARSHADEHGIDPATIVLAGSSAGAHLTAMAALTANDPALQPGFETADTSVTAAVGFYGYYGALGDTPERASTPLAYEPVDAPPFLLVHGTNDTYTSIQGARALARHLRAGSPNPVVLAELDGAQHSFDVFHSVRYDAVVDAVEAFAGVVSRPQRNAGSAASSRCR